VSAAPPRASELAVTVTWDGARVVDAAVALARPRASAVLRGLAAGEALALVPRLFALCGRAQAAAARAALAAAGEPVPAADDDGAVLREASQEHLWRVLRDWPRALGLAPRDDLFATWYRRLAAPARPGDAPRAGDALAALAAFVDAEVLGPRFEALATRADLARWSRRTDTLGAALVRALRDAGGAPSSAAGWIDPRAPLATVIDGPWAPELEVRPTHGGRPAETGAVARFREAPLVADLLGDPGSHLLARLVARLLSAADVARRLAAGERAHVESCAPLPGVGLGRVETARGALVHRVRLDRGRIAEYAVIAPTAWNFHPRGAFRGACAAVRARSEDAVRAEVVRWVLAFDPCVPCRIDVDHSP
jgi:hypothetical protein